MKLHRFINYRGVATCLVIASIALPVSAVVIPTGYTYDSDDRLTQVTYPDGRQITYTYDDGGNITSITTRNDSPPTVLVADSIDGTIGLPIPDYQIPVNRSSGITGYIATGLPAGLQINKGTTVNSDGKAPGTIYGTPTASGMFAVQLSAKNAVGSGLPVTLNVSISNPFSEIDDRFDLAGNVLVYVPVSEIAGAELGGSISLAITSSGSFSGRLTLGAAKYSLKGRFHGETGDATITIERAVPFQPLTLTMHLGLKGESRGALSGSLSDGSDSATLDGVVAAWSKINPASAFAGPKGATYNIGLIPDSSHAANPAFPKGAGFAFVKIKPSGEAQLTGKLADGTAISGKSFVSTDGEAPFVVSLYSGKGILSGVLTVLDGGSVNVLSDNALVGSLSWMRPAISGNLYQSGFPGPMTVNVTGGVYAAPTKGVRILDLGSAAGHSPVTLTLSDAGLSPDITSVITISTLNKVTLFTPDDNSLALTFTPSSGLFSGKFTVPAPSRKTAFQGILLPASEAVPSQGFGYFLLPGATKTDPVLSGQALIDR